MPVGVSAAASAIAVPRSRTRTMACSAVMTPAPAAAVISPTEWPATAPTGESVGRVREERERGDQPGATISGWAIAVSLDRLGVGLGAVVGQVDAGHRGQPGEAVANAGSSSQGARKPGVWEPWPGRR